MKSVQSRCINQGPFTDDDIRRVWPQLTEITFAYKSGSHFTVFTNVWSPDKAWPDLGISLIYVLKAVKGFAPQAFRDILFRKLRYKAGQSKNHGNWPARRYRNFPRKDIAWVKVPAKVTRYGQLGTFQVEDAEQMLALSKLFGKAIRTYYYHGSDGSHTPYRTYKPDGTFTEDDH
jgi:hypothetical protein